MPKTPPDWTRTGTIEGYAKWLQKASGALAVIVVRVNDSALALRCLRMEWVLSL